MTIVAMSDDTVHLILIALAVLKMVVLVWSSDSRSA